VLTDPVSWKMLSTTSRQAEGSYVTSVNTSPALRGVDR
jgi:hypothetical protein